VINAECFVQHRELGMFDFTARPLAEKKGVYSRYRKRAFHRLRLRRGVPRSRCRRRCSDRVFFQSENGLIGTGPIPEHGMAHPLLTDAGGRPISALPGACYLRQRDVVRLDPWWARHHQRARRTSSRCRRSFRQLDDSGQDGARHGRCRGPGDRR
jgi:hypothetical protein